MNNSAKVSIIVPVYNVEKYLSVCMDSCINQTLYDIEIICVNDGSTDKSLEILEKYAAIDNRIKIINKKNGGLSSARNAGIKASNGNWIMFLESDDSLSLNACERIWKEALEEPTDIIVFGSDMFPSHPQPSEWHKWVLNVQTKRVYLFTPEVLLNIPSSKPFVWRQAFSKELLEKTGVLFDESVKYGEDIVFQFEIFPYASNISYIADKLYNYRHYRKGSLMESINLVPSKKVWQHLYSVDTILAYWQEKGWIEKYGFYILAWVLDFVVTDLRRNNYDETPEFAKTIRDYVTKYELHKYKYELPKDKMELYKSLQKM